VSSFSFSRCTSNELNRRQGGPKGRSGRFWGRDKSHFSAGIERGKSSLSLSLSLIFSSIYVIYVLVRRFLFDFLRFDFPICCLS
jgi:hypothetical protein